MPSEYRKKFGPWAYQAEEHWKKYRPKMYAELKEDPALLDKLLLGLKGLTDSFGS